MRSGAGGSVYSVAIDFGQWNSRLSGQRKGGNMDKDAKEKMYPNWMMPVGMLLRYIEDQYAIDLDTDNCLNMYLRMLEWWISEERKQWGEERKNDQN